MTLHAPADVVGQAIKDVQTVTPSGELLAERIEGVEIRRATTVADQRGTICEIYNPAWGFTPEAMVYAYEATIRGGVTKGWIVHEESDDRLFFQRGSVRVVLYDAREDSPTAGMVNELFFEEANRGLLRIPRGVFHVVQNLGQETAVFINLPTRPYDHANPDKRRLPLDTDLIPFEL